MRRRQRGVRSTTRRGRFSGKCLFNYETLNNKQEAVEYNKKPKLIKNSIPGAMNYRLWAINMNIPFHKTYITDDEINEVVDSLKSGWITMGPKTVRFEEEFNRYIGSKHSIAVNSCQR